MDQTSDEISLKELINHIKKLFFYIRAKWSVICLACIIGGTFGYIYSNFQKPIYTASITYALDDEKSNGSLSGAMGLASTLGFDVGTSGGGAFGAANLMELMHSRYLIEKTLL